MKVDELADIMLVIMCGIAVLMLIAVAAMELSGCGRQREERGERRARVEAIMWHEEMAGMREAQEAYLRERKYASMYDLRFTIYDMK